MGENWMKGRAGDSETVGACTPISTPTHTHTHTHTPRRDKGRSPDSEGEGMWKHPILSLLTAGLPLVAKSNKKPPAGSPHPTLSL